MRRGHIIREITYRKDSKTDNMWQNLLFYPITAAAGQEVFVPVIAGLIVFVVVLCAGVAFLGIQFQKVYKEKERYDLIAAHNESIWLDYTFSPQHLVVTGDIGSFTGFDVLDFMGVEVYDIYNWVNEEVTPIRSEIRNFFDSGEECFKKDLLLHRLDDTYAWYAVSGTLVKSEKNRKNKRFVMRMENIDSQMTQEKELTEMAENDLLTGILNKKTMESRISVQLEHRIGSENLVFFMIDLDNFKEVNDNLGHAYGDRVLTETAEKIKQVFPSNALIGRLGGDEFAVFAGFDAFDLDNLTEYMTQKGEQLCQGLKAEYANGDHVVEVSASIGIASAPTDGEDFMSIYQKADKALYLSKRSGKDRYNLFQHSAADE